MSSCKFIADRETSWPYEQYYIGQKDAKGRRSSTGENHWTGAKSQERYKGNFVQNTMNGQGDYFWRYKGDDGTSTTYEGRFLANKMHGYGMMSYSDGRTFTGLFYNNFRWGPGIQRHASLQADIGFWRDQQLVRLTWRPRGYSLIPNFNDPRAKPFVDKQRILLAEKCTIIGETNEALELLKQYGPDPVWASKNWHKLYSPYATDLQSLACQVNLFERNYYQGKYVTLVETVIPEPGQEFSITDIDTQSIKTQDRDILVDPEPKTKTEYFYAWNNNKMMVEIMKHCYQHDKFRDPNLKLPFEKIVSGPRRQLKLAGDHERYCRNLILASYLGHITNVVTLINEQDVYPDVADVQGNTPLIYATCGDHSTVINFLVDAGADVDAYNDSCCTALAIALIRFVCKARNVGIKQVSQCLMPSAAPQSEIEINEWIIDRGISQTIQNEGPKSLSKPNLKISSLNLKKASKIMSKRMLATIESQGVTSGLSYDSDDSYSEEKRMYTNLRREYDIRVDNVLMESPVSVVPYVFNVENMNKAIETLIHSLKEVKKPVKEIRTSKLEPRKLVSEMEVNVRPTKIMDTICQLLSCGADPKLVVIPQPPLYMSIIADSPTLVRLMLEYGVDPNEQFPMAGNYTALDIAMSRRMTPNIVSIIETLLENGARADYRLPYPDEPGPTLLHALLSKPMTSLVEEKLFEETLMLLLKHCDPFIRFLGVSATEILIIKRFRFLDCLCMFPNIDLNNVINELNQTILLKIFTWSQFKQIADVPHKPLIKNLLVNGANPLLVCHDNQEEYLSIFEYARTILAIIDPDSEETSILDVRQAGIPQLRSVIPLKKTDRPSPILINAYKDAIDVMIEHSRTIHARLLQTKMVKSLVAVIYKFKHRRHWHMIFKEFKDLNLVGLGIWLTPERCFDIWYILGETRNKIYKDEVTLKHLICIVLFFNYENFKNKPELPTSNIISSLNGHKKRKIDADASYLIKEYKNSYEKPNEVEKIFQNVYLKPDLATKDDEKDFNICFDCCMPLQLYKSYTVCTLCNAVKFCSLACMTHSIEETYDHPCRKFLKEEASIASAFLEEQ